MDIKVPLSWLKEYIKTNASYQEIAKYLSLCGPSVERVEKIKNDVIFHIEITSNRIDCSSIMGIARELSAILPRFNIKAKLIPPRGKKEIKLSKKVNYLEAYVNQRLCRRFTAVLIKNATVKLSPNWLKNRLTSIGVKTINNVVDVSNYLLYELGQPVHTFDYDKIIGKKMILRESKKGEKIETLDGKIYTLAGGDIVIEDGGKRLIDLAGIMGGKNTMVDKNTKNVLLFVQTYNPTSIRKTSMYLAKRTDAATFFEKGLDPQNVVLTLERGIYLLEKLTGGKATPDALDINFTRNISKKIKIEWEFIERKIGVSLPRKKIKEFLFSLGFSIKETGYGLEVEIPSFRANDISLKEDIVEEIARIYGYFNIPPILPITSYPKRLSDAPFDFEFMLKQILKALGGIEIYTLSLVGKDEAEKNALFLKNPLGKKAKYLRTTLFPSLLKAAQKNSKKRKKFHIFEMGNIYLPQKDDLPEEKMYLGGIIYGYPLRKAKGIVESILDELNIITSDKVIDADTLSFKYRKEDIGKFKMLEKKLYYYEFEVKKLMSLYSLYKRFKKPSKYPPIIEDITFSLPTGILFNKIKERIEKIKNIQKISLVKTYKNFYTIRIFYHDTKRSLSNSTVKEIRERVIKSLKNLGAVVKE